MKNLHDRDVRQAKPFCFSRFLVRFNWVVLIISIVVPLVMAAVVQATGALEFNVNSEYQYIIREDPIVQDGLALIAAREDLIQGDPTNETQSNQNYFWEVTVYYRSLSGNALTAESFNAQKRIEDQIQAYQDYSEFCYHDGFVNCEGEVPQCGLPATVLLIQTESDPGNSLFGQSVNGEDYVCGYSGEDTVDDATVSEVLPTWFDSDGAVKSDIAYFLGSDANATDQRTAYVRSDFRMGSPLAGYESSEDREDEQDEKFTEWAQGLRDYAVGLGGDDFEILVYSGALYEQDIGDLSLTDFVWILGSVVFVGFYMCMHTGSIYLGLMGLLQIILAFPLTYFVYRLIFQVQFFSNLHLLAVFLILGIGADDVFVFTDAFVQSGGVLGQTADLVQRISWSYRRAAKAMLITSITTAAAFFVTASNNLIPISAFGIWAGLLIILQYCLCIFMFPANLVVWDQQFRWRYWRKCLKKVDPVTEEVPGSEEDEAKKQAILEQGHELDEVPESGKCCFCIPVDSTTDKYAEREGGGEDFGGTRGVERFFHSLWSPLLGRLRYVTLVVAALILALAIWGATKLEPLEEEEQFIPDWHPAQQPLVWSREYYGSGTGGGDVLTISVVHGIEGLDQSEVARWDPDDIGTPIYDMTFDLTLAVNRNFLVEQCNEIGADPELTLQGDAVDCWIQDFQDFIPNPDQDFESDQQVYFAVLQFLNFTNDAGEQENLDYFWNIGLSTTEERVMFSVFEFDTPNPSLSGFRNTMPVYEQWAQVMADQNAKAPEGVNGAYATSIEFLFMVTEKDLVDSAVRGLGISLAVAFVVMAISTFNIVISFFAICIVGAIVACVIALMYVYGWAWGISESVAVVLIVGFSVDYVVHLANAYVESFNTKRYRRTRDALTEMGVSIVAGAITTFGSGVFLIGGVIIFFDKFGIVMMTTIALSLAWSTIGFATLIMVVGPNGNFGSYYPLVAPIFRWCGNLFGKCFSCCGRKYEEEADDQPVTEEPDVTVNGDADLPTTHVSANDEVVI